MAREPSTKEKVIPFRFVRPDGSPVRNAVQGGATDQDGNPVFFEILGMSKLNGVPPLKRGGKEVYKRVLIQRVFPVVDESFVSGLESKGTE